MLILLLSCLSFVLVFNSISFSSMSQIELSNSVLSCMRTMRLVFEVPKVLVTLLTRPSGSSVAVSVDCIDDDEQSLLDLPDLALDNILERLSPGELCSMAGVSSHLRDRCRSDYLWKRHMKQKWGKVIGDNAFRDWQRHVDYGNRGSQPNGNKCEDLLGYLSRFWPLSLVTWSLESRNSPASSSSSVDSIMARYLSLESGKCWFVAQVYNRENGHGFMLSCYDAELSYNSANDTFKARYSPRGRHKVEEDISWDRLRAPPVDTPPYVLHLSDCLGDLKPGDHFEIQWRRNRDYPYGWWYGVVGHLDSCIRNENWCQCHDSETVMLEFNQYPVDSRWRRTTVNRMNHREQGNEADGFYGGIRKLYDPEEISTWKSIWPKNILD